MLTELVRELSPRIRVAIRGFAQSDDEADDLLQDCWVQILQDLDSYGQRGSFAAWAVSVSKRCCNRRVHVEERVRAAEVAVGHPGEMPETLDETQWTAEQSNRISWEQVVHDALGQLPDRERDVIVLRLLEGRDTAETAIALGISESGVRLILLRAMTRLRRMKGLREVLPQWIGGN